MSALALDRRRVAKNTFSQIVAFGISGATKAVVAVVVARTLGPQGFGLFTLAWTIASMVALFAPLGLDYRLVRELNRDGTSREVDVSLPPALLSACVGSVLVAGIPWIAGASHQLVLALAAGGLFVVLSAPVLILRAAFHARERMELETLALAVEGLVGLGGVAIALSISGSVPAAMLGLAAGRVANLVVSIRCYRSQYGKLGFKVQVNEWPGLLRVAVPMGFSYIFNSLLVRFDIVLLAMLRTPEEIGLYSAATIIIMTIPMVSSALNTSLYPVLSRARSSDDPELKTLFASTYRMQLVVGLAAAAGLMVLARPISDLLYGSSFVGTAAVIVALAPILPFRFVNSLSGVALNATDRQRSRTVATAIGASANIALNLALIPFWGYKGAIVATLATEAILTIVMRRHLADLAPSLLKPLAQGAVAAGGLALVVMVTPGHVLLRTSVGAAAFGVLAWLIVWSGKVVGSTPRAEEARA